MPESIFLIHKNGEMVEMNSEPYVSEDFIQGLLADHPNLIAGNQFNPEAPRRWRSDRGQQIGTSPQMTA